MELSSFLLAMDPCAISLYSQPCQGTIVASLAIDARRSLSGEVQLLWFVVHPLYNPDDVCTSLVAEGLRFCSKK